MLTGTNLVFYSVYDNDLQTKIVMDISTSVELEIVNKICLQGFPAFDVLNGF